MTEERLHNLRRASFKLNGAASVLVRAPGTLEERLVRAMLETFDNTTLSLRLRDERDAELRERWEALTGRMTSEPIGSHDGLYAAAVASMDELELGAVADQLRPLARDVYVQEALARSEAGLLAR